MHIGLEVEGRLKGLPTLMLTPDEFRSGKYKSVKAYYTNIYITDSHNELDLDIIDAERDPFNDPILSIERSWVDKIYPNLNIIICVNAPVWSLKPTDQIRMHDGRDVWMVPVESMLRSVPADFEGDFNV